MREACTGRCRWIPLCEIPSLYQDRAHIESPQGFVGSGKVTARDLNLDTSVEKSFPDGLAGIRKAGLG